MKGEQKHIYLLAESLLLEFMLYVAVASFPSLQDASCSQKVHRVHTVLHEFCRTDDILLEEKKPCTAGGRCPQCHWWLSAPFSQAVIRGGSWYCWSITNLGHPGLLSWVCLTDFCLKAIPEDQDKTFKAVPACFGAGPVVFLGLPNISMAWLDLWPGWIYTWKRFWTSGLQT